MEKIVLNHIILGVIGLTGVNVNQSVLTINPKLGKEIVPRMMFRIVLFLKKNQTQILSNAKLAKAILTVVALMDFGQNGPGGHYVVNYAVRVTRKGSGFARTINHTYLIRV
jgi:hypothetical protein